MGIHGDSLRRAVAANQDLFKNLVVHHVDLRPVTINFQIFPKTLPSCLVAEEEAASEAPTYRGTMKNLSQLRLFQTSHKKHSLLSTYLSHAPSPPTKPSLLNATETSANEFVMDHTIPSSTRAVSQMRRRAKS